MKQDHVVIDESDGHPTVKIDDWELFDFIEDHLDAHDLEYDYLTEEKVGHRSIFIMHFRVGVDLGRLKDVIERIDPREIQRIWKINN